MSSETTPKSHFLKHKNLLRELEQKKMFFYGDIQKGFNLPTALPTKILVVYFSLHIKSLKKNQFYYFFQIMRELYKKVYYFRKRSS